MNGVIFLFTGQRASPKLFAVPMLAVNNLDFHFEDRHSREATIIHFKIPMILEIDGSMI